LTRPLHLWFTFNSLFQLTAGLNVLVETIGHSGNSTMSATLAGITVHDAVGLAVPSAQLTAVPEPAAASFVAVGLALLAPWLVPRLKQAA
jgi:hypothetical protein